jgi:hypothetical protein
MSRDGAYRAPAEASADAEAAALHDLSRRTGRLRVMLLLPGGILALVAATANALAHTMGFWALFGVLEDGRYPVSGTTVAIAALVPAATLAAPFVLAYILLHARVRRAWRTDAARTLGLDGASLDALMRMLD